MTNSLYYLAPENAERSLQPDLFAQFQSLTRTNINKCAADKEVVCKTSLVGFIVFLCYLIQLSNAFNTSFWIVGYCVLGFLAAIHNICGCIDGDLWSS